MAESFSSPAVPDWISPFGRRNPDAFGGGESKALCQGANSLRRFEAYLQHLCESVAGGGNGDGPYEVTTGDTLRLMQSPFDTPEIGLGPAPTEVSNILVVRPGGLGEMVNAIPALRHLRSIYGASRVTVAAEHDALQLVQECPYVDRTIELASEADVERLAAGSVDPAFELVVMFGDPNRPLAGWAADKLSMRMSKLRDVQYAAYRLGTDELRHTVHPVWPNRISDLHRMLRLVWLLGGVKPDHSMTLWPTLASRNAAAKLLGSITAPIAVVHVGGKRAERRWPIERYARAVTFLKDSGLQVVAIGGESDVERVRQLQQLTTSPILDLSGITSVGELAALMERAALFVGNDSGPAMLAIALGVNTTVVGPASTVDRFGTADRVSYIDTESDDQDVDNISIANVLEHLTFAAHRSVRSASTFSALTS